MIEAAAFSNFYHKLTQGFSFILELGFIVCA